MGNCRRVWLKTVEMRQKLQGALAVFQPTATGREVSEGGPVFRFSGENCLQQGRGLGKPVAMPEFDSKFEPGPQVIRKGGDGLREDVLCITAPVVLAGLDAAFYQVTQTDICHLLLLSAPIGALAIII